MLLMVNLFVKRIADLVKINIDSWLTILVSNLVVIFVLFTPLSLAASVVPKLEMIQVQGGLFTLGCQPKDLNCESDEVVHNISIPTFLVSKYPITNGQFVQFLNTQHRHKNTVGKHWVELKSDDNDSHLLRTKGTYFVEAGFELFPVIEVSWAGAMRYAQWMSVLSKRAYQLPTEDQWEVMARANNDISCISTVGCQFIEQYLGSKKGQQKVQKGMSNSLGIIDFLANSWEWTCSNYSVLETSYRSTCSQSSLWDSHKTIKGCSWHSNFWECRLSNRAHQDMWYQNHQTSFRLVIN